MGICELNMTYILCHLVFVQDSLTPLPSFYLVRNFANNVTFIYHIYYKGVGYVNLCQTLLCSILQVPIQDSEFTGTFDLIP